MDPSEPTLTDGMWVGCWPDSEWVVTGDGVRGARWDPVNLIEVGNILGKDTCGARVFHLYPDLARPNIHMVDAHRIAVERFLVATNAAVNLEADTDVIGLIALAGGAPGTQFARCNFVRAVAATPDIPPLLTARNLLSESEYVLNAVEEFASQLNDRSPWTLDYVIRLINLSARQGYRPVVTYDGEDNSLEIEARLDQSRLLLLQVWTSGTADALIFSESDGFTAIEANEVGAVLTNLVASGLPE